MKVTAKITKVPETVRRLYDAREVPINQFRQGNTSTVSPIFMSAISRKRREK